MTQKIISCTIIFLAAMLYGCSAGNEAVSLKSTHWQLDSIIGLKIVPEGKSVTVDFSSTGNVSGYGGCNNFGGTYKTSGKNISFIDIYATDMACINSQVEANFLAALKKTDSYKISGGKLMLYETGKLLVILFERL